MVTHHKNYNFKKESNNNDNIEPNGFQKGDLSKIQIEFILSFTKLKISFVWHKARSMEHLVHELTSNNNLLI